MLSVTGQLTTNSLEVGGAAAGTLLVIGGSLSSPTIDFGSYALATVTLNGHGSIVASGDIGIQNTQLSVSGGSNITAGRLTSETDFSHIYQAPSLHSDIAISQNSSIKVSELDLGVSGHPVYLSTSQNDSVTVRLDDSVINADSISLDYNSSIDASDYAVIDVQRLGVANGGSIVVRGGSLLRIDGSLPDPFVLSLSGGNASVSSLTINPDGLVQIHGSLGGGIENDGQITGFAGNLELYGTLTGTGFVTAESGTKFALLGSIAASQTLKLNGSGNTLFLGDGANILAPIMGLTAGDVIAPNPSIDVGGIINSVAYDQNQHQLTAVLQGRQYTLNLVGGYTQSNFVLDGDKIDVVAVSGPSQPSIDPQVAALINSTYMAELARPASDADITGWAANFASGDTLAHLQSVLGTSAEAATAISNTYSAELGRPAAAADIAGWQSNLAHGDTLAHLQSVLGISLEAAAAITGAYNAALGRPAFAADISGWLNNLAHGDTLAHLQSVLGASSEAATAITNTYTAELGRPASTADVAGWQSNLANGDTIGHLQSVLSGSSEAINAIGNTYVGVLGRVASIEDFSGWESNLAHGDSLGHLRSLLASSSEAAGDISSVYQRALGHAPDPLQIAAGQSELLSGLNLAQVYGQIGAIKGGSIPTIVATATNTIQITPQTIAGTNGTRMVFGLPDNLGVVIAGSAQVSAQVGKLQQCASNSIWSEYQHCVERAGGWHGDQSRSDERPVNITGSN